MWMMPLHLHVNQKSDYDDMMTSSWLCTQCFTNKTNFYNFLFLYLDVSKEELLAKINKLEEENAGMLS